jgi:hypothetical protein
LARKEELAAKKWKLQGWCRTAQASGQCELQFVSNRSFADVSRRKDKQKWGSAVVEVSKYRIECRVSNVEYDEKGRERV